MWSERLISKHNKYILNILQQFTQARRLKNLFTILEGAFNNTNEWIHSNLHTNLGGSNLEMFSKGVKLSDIYRFTPASIK